MKVKKISGGVHNFPAVGRDVEEGEVVEVPDDVLLPTEHFQEVTEKPAKATKDKE